MKNLLILFAISLLGLSIGCQKNDDRAPMEIALQNEPPLSFGLLGMTSKVDVYPTLAWTSAENPKGSAVSYDLYLGTEANPTTLFESDIPITSFKVTQGLQLKTDYYWKVVAKDLEGKTSQSAIHKFTTRYYRFQGAPIAQNAGFSPRSGHTSSVYEGKIWVIGGYDGGRKNDVWNSTDGISWSETTASANFSERNSHAMTVFKDKMWVVGGFGGLNTFNDVWNSANGINWTEATASAEFSERHSHSLLVFEDKLWIIGGRRNGIFYNDVWYSDDGTNWIEASSSAPFDARANHATVVFDKKIWVIGGFTTEGTYKNDIWYSSDGTNWTEGSEFIARAGHTAVTFDNRIWVVAGGSELSKNSNVWYSENDFDWWLSTSAASFPIRASHTSVVFDNKIWVIGGSSGNPHNIRYNDVWATE